MRKIFSLILVIALISAMFIGTAVQANGTATVTLSSTYAENGQYEVIATIQGGTFTNGDVVLNVGTNVTLKSLISTLDPTAGYSLKNGVLTFSFAPEAAVDCTQAKELFKATFEIAAGVDASAVIVPTLGAETEIQYVEPTSDTPVDFTPALDTEDFKVEKDTITGVAFGNNTTVYNGQTQSVTVTGLPAGASVVYQNNEGKNVGTYQATATVSLAGYKDLVLNATLTITPAPVTITADSLEMTQNGTIPNFTYKVTSGTVYENDAITGALSATTDGTAVGTFPIAQGTLAVSSNYTLTFVDGILTVKEASSAPTVLLGDVNEDGNVTVQDAQRLYEHLNGSDPLETTSNGYLAADVNQDGNVTVQDAQRLYEHLNGSDPLE